MQKTPYGFRPARIEDLDRLRRWQARAHVAAWWDDDDPFDDEDLADPRLRHRIVTLRMRPFGFIQDYDVHGWGGHHFDSLPDGARGIDQYIGVPGLVGKGHGSAMIRARVSAMFAQGVPVVATDPHPGNGRAIAAYRKVGFEVAGPAQRTRWGLVLPMEYWSLTGSRGG